MGIREEQERLMSQEKQGCKNVEFLKHITGRVQRYTTSSPPILQMKGQRPRERKGLAQGHGAGIQTKSWMLFAPLPWEASGG